MRTPRRGLPDAGKRRSPDGAVFQPEQKRRRGSALGTSSDSEQNVEIADVETDGMSLLGGEDPLDDLAIQQWTSLQSSGTEDSPPNQMMSDTELAERRLQQIRQLYRTYQVAFWAAAEEYRALTALKNQAQPAGTPSPGVIPGETEETVSVQELVRRHQTAEDADTVDPEAGTRIEGPPALLSDPLLGDGADAAVPFADAVIAAVRAAPAGPPGGAPVDAARLRAWKLQLRDELPKIARLEQAASAEMAHELDAQGALAAIDVLGHRFCIFRTAFSFGRSPTADVSWRLVTDSMVPSREGGSVQMQWDGSWLLSVEGRGVLVNNTPVYKGETAVLKQHSLVDVGQMAFMFSINQRAVKRLLHRSKSFNRCV